MQLGGSFPYMDGFESSQRDILNNASLWQQQRPQKSSLGLTQESLGTAMTRAAVSSFPCSSAKPVLGPGACSRSPAWARGTAQNVWTHSRISQLAFTCLFFYLLLPWGHLGSGNTVLIHCYREMTIWICTCSATRQPGLLPSFKQPLVFCWTWFDMLHAILFTPFLWHQSRELRVSQCFLNLSL